MSSYLNIYLKPKKSEEKLLLASYGRNNEVYQAINENIHIAYIGNSENDEDNFTKLSAGDLQDVIHDCEETISHCKKRLDAYNKHLQKTVEGVNEILELEEYIDELKETLHTIQDWYSIAENIEDDFTDFEGMYANID